MKFKVGDKVRVKKDLEVDTEHGNYMFVEGMEEYKGKEFIIDKVCTNYYRLKNIYYCWTDEMLEPIEREKNNMNIEELNLEYKNKMDALMEEYKTKAKELAEEEPFIREGQRYFSIDSVTFKVNNYCYYCDEWDESILECGNCYPFTDENREQVEKEVNLIAERRKLQSEMEMFARQNNDKFDWRNTNQKKWYLYIDYTENNIRKGYILCSRHFNTVYFTSEEIAQQALEKFGDRIRELYLKEEQ